MNVYRVLTGSTNVKYELKQNLEVTNFGNVDSNKKKGADVTIFQIREDHKTLFENDKYWEILKVAIALNVEGTIKKLDSLILMEIQKYVKQKIKQIKHLLTFYIDSNHQLV